MFGREDLIWEWSDDLDAGFKVYDVEKVNEIMDRMEARIKQLEKENEDMDRMKTRIKELETKLAKEKSIFSFFKRRIK